MTVAFHPLLRFLYTIAVATALFTGFGNMPLWKRYYVADIPGLGWSGDFFINVNVHILAGSLLMALAVYAVIGALAVGHRDGGRLTFFGKTKGALLTVALATGILMVVKNLPGFSFSMQALMIFNFTHLAAAVLFLLFSLAALVFRQPWRRLR